MTNRIALAAAAANVVTMATVSAGAVMAVVVVGWCYVYYTCRYSAKQRMFRMRPE